MAKRNAQFAIEFVVLLAFMFFVFVGFMAVATSKVSDAKAAERQKVAKDIAEVVMNEIRIASSVANGYLRAFTLPPRLEGVEYNVEILENRELIVNYLDKEHVSFLPENVCGDVYIPNNEISKEKGIVCINSNLDRNQCDNAQNLGLCDKIDEEVLRGSKCCCCRRHGLCC